MLATICPHCRTQLLVKKYQLNVAQGLVVCNHCHKVFQARNHIIDIPTTQKNKDSFNWTLASLVALTVLIVQLFYSALQL